jgi:hypothetical protein
MPRKIRLIPILEHLGACRRALGWLEDQKYETFETAIKYANPRDVSWLYSVLDREGFKFEEIYAEARKVHTNRGPVYEGTPRSYVEVPQSYMDVLRAHWMELQKALIEYAKRHDCLHYR